MMARVHRHHHRRRVKSSSKRVWADNYRLGGTRAVCISLVAWAREAPSCLFLACWYGFLSALLRSGGLSACLQVFFFFLFCGLAFWRVFLAFSFGLGKSERCIFLKYSSVWRCTNCRRKDGWEDRYGISICPIIICSVILLPAVVSFVAPLCGFKLEWFEIILSFLISFKISASFFFRYLKLADLKNGKYYLTCK